MSNNLIFFSENLSTFRKEKGWTQSELAEKLGVKANTISNYEKGISTPDYKIIAKLRELFEMPTDVLLYSNLSEGKEKFGEWVCRDKDSTGWRTFKISLGEKKKEYVIVDANSALAVDGVTKLRYKRAGIYQKRLVGNGIAKAMVVKNMPKVVGADFEGDDTELAKKSIANRIGINLKSDRKVAYCKFNRFITMGDNSVGTVSEKKVIPTNLTLTRRLLALVDKKDNTISELNREIGRLQYEIEVLKKELSLLRG